MAARKRRWKQLEMFGGAMNPIRPPMDTLSEIDALEVAAGVFLDEVAKPEGISRMDGEPDDLFRDRLRNAVRIRRASERVERGESLLPSAEEIDLSSFTTEIERLRREVLDKDLEIEALREKLVRLEDEAASKKT